MEKGIYVRVAGTTRLADNCMIKELMFEGANRCFDQTPCIGYDVSEEDIKNLCSSLRKTAIENCKTDRSENIASKKLQQSCGFHYTHSQLMADKRDGLKHMIDFYELTRNV